MITIKTEKHTYTAKMAAEDSEKLFKKLVMELFGYTERLSIPETEMVVIPEIPAYEAENEGKTEEIPDAMKELEEYIEDKYSVDPVTEPELIGKENDGYSGFLHIKCQHCGKERTFCSKYKIKSCKCKECGEKTELKDLVQLYINCECGTSRRYFTNQTEAAFDVKCINCGQPVAVKYNKKKNLYETIR